MELERKLQVLADAAKYDVACTTSGASRQNSAAGLGGICHSWTADGRCVSLLKILFSNVCIYDCAYCQNRRSNAIPRATFTVDELVRLTVEFYRRNYIEGLFLSSGVIRSPDFTMEKMCAVVERLRRQERFTGYIHLKIVPGASRELIERAGFLADRISLNIELPSEESLKRLAPEKKRENILVPLRQIGQQIEYFREERRRHRKAPRFSPAGQSTQLIVGATPETDLKILRLAESLYQKVNLKRVYYSAYIPVNQSSLLPAISAPPLSREHRLYQSDWLLRFYGFRADEILDPGQPFLDEGLDPKEQWALRHPEFFPVEINCADYWQLLRVPGIGIRSAKRILAARRWHSLDFQDLAKIGVVLKRAQYFITCSGRPLTGIPGSFEGLRRILSHRSKRDNSSQLTLFLTNQFESNHESLEL